MLILSWDVGIIHLAYCILEYNTQKKLYKIHYWDQINLTNYDENAFKCKFIDKKPCTANGKFFYINNNIECYLCGRHKKKYIPELVDIDSYFTKEKEGTCDYINNKKKCVKNATYYNENEKYCTIHAKSKINKINKNLIPQSIKKINSMKMSIDILRFNLVNKLDKLDFLLNVDKVLIENQPTLKNPKMKSISSTIYDYFLIRGIIDKKNNSTIKEVKYISPSNKLKVNADNTIQTLSKTTDNQKYKMTKQLGIQYCKQLISHDEQNLLLLESYKKKDDLCDAFLQGAHYISKNLD